MKNLPKTFSCVYDVKVDFHDADKVWEQKEITLLKTVEQQLAFSC